MPELGLTHWRDVLIQDGEERERLLDGLPPALPQVYHLGLDQHRPVAKKQLLLHGQPHGSSRLAEM